MLTNTEKAKIRWYMGSSDKWTDLFTALEHSFDRVTAEAIVLIQGALTQLDDIYEVRLPNTYTRLKARKVGSIGLSTEIEISMLRSEGRRLVNTISATLGVHPERDVFSGYIPTDNRRLY